MKVHEWYYGRMSKEHIFIIGPGGVGKSTSGALLARILEVPLIDLDREFMRCVGHIGEYIQTHGYEKYCYANSELFSTLLREASDPSLFIMSSGFLVHDGLEELVEKHKRLLKENGISILLLPSESLEASADLVVKRQMSRGFGLNEEVERNKFMKRYERYQKEGDIKIYSIATPQEIAFEMTEYLQRQKQVLQSQHE